ncbi:serine/threonine-protein phosphatase 6 regulatory subunit [Anaeramoeba flamelloides]|uniref:Serine/threonine-protein phosphatase 6 regulatory subunit n=1 Tax=Anaeramoeba flamelloides TaxID=1746091 RepID=A0ABQ8Z831_9EUKA|nr:serine/threonine-protein phosphatase 6 regulatory subunit [Anaeramoeba flamelloides]
MTFDFSLSSQSRILEILEEDPIVFEELLIEDELIQECQFGNKLLVEYLSQKDVVELILKYLLVPPKDENASEEEKIVYPFNSNEIIGLEIYSIIEVTCQEDSLMDKIFKFLDQDNINSVYAGYFSHVVTIQLKRRWEETLAYLEKKPEIIDKLILHIGTSAIKDVILCLLIGCEKENLYERTSKFLSSTKIVTKLIKLLNEENTSIVHENVTKCIVDFIFHLETKKKYVMELESLETINKLLNCLLGNGTNESLISNSLTIIIELLIYINQQNRIILTNNSTHPLLLSIFQKIENIIKLLDPKTIKKKFELSFGTIQSPLGNSRLKLIQLFHILFFVSKELSEMFFSKYKILSIILDHFFQYKWNNFLHNYVRDFIHTIFETNSIKLIEEMVDDYKIIEKIITISKQYPDIKKNKEFDRGNFNHIFQIANKFAMYQTKTKSLNQKLTEIKGWEEFINNFLKNIKKIESTKIGIMNNTIKNIQKNQNNLTTNDDDNDEIELFKDMDDDDDDDDDFDLDFLEKIGDIDEDDDDDDDEFSWFDEKNKVDSSKKEENSKNFFDYLSSDEDDDKLSNSSDDEEIKNTKLIVSDKRKLDRKKKPKNIESEEPKDKKIKNTRKKEKFTIRNNYI